MTAPFLSQVPAGAAPLHEAQHPATAAGATSAAAPLPATAHPQRRKTVLLAAGGAAAAALAGGLWWMLQPSLSIQGVRTAQAPMVADGKPRPVLLRYAAHNTRPERVDVRFVGGDVRWPTPAWSVPIEQAAANTGEVSAGPLAYRSAVASKATFEYTLVDAQGRRSVPLRHSVDFLPPIAITQARWASTPRPGQTATLLVSYKRGGGDIVSARQTVVDSQQSWPQPTVDTPLALADASGSVSLQLPTPPGPARGTVEVVLADALGVQSEPLRVAINTQAQALISGPATVLSVAGLGGGTSGAGAVAGGAVGAAVGNNFGKGSGRALATLLGGIGGAVAGNHIEGNIRGPAQWETVVRFDDGNTRRVVQGTTPGWQAGDRVRVSPGGGVSR